MQKQAQILFVFDWLVVGGEETELRLLARYLRPRYQISVAACFRNEHMTELTVRNLQRMGIPLDTTCYALDDEGRRRYLAEKIRREQPDIVVACQGVTHAYRALELLEPHERPILIEHGGLVVEATRTPKHLTTAYIGVCRDIVEAAQRVMPDPSRAYYIPSMVDLAEFEGHDRAEVRRELGFAPEHLVVGWVGRLDRKKRVEDFIEAAAILRERLRRTRFVIIGGPDAFMPEYADELRALACERGLEPYLVFTGDRDDVPRLLHALDAYVWLSRGEGMPHAILEAGAARLPVIATRDGGTPDVIVDGETGLFVPHQAPAAVAAALERVLTQPALATRLGMNLRRRVEREFATAVVCRQWEELFERLLSERRSALGDAA
jgi:glycosyltransferase involved in cell wall biosynthesis